MYHPKVTGEEPVWDNPLFFIIFFPLCPGFSLQAIILLCTTLELLETLASAAAALREESLFASSHLHAITDWLRLEGTSGDDPDQPLTEAGTPGGLPRTVSRHFPHDLGCPMGFALPGTAFSQATAAHGLCTESDLAISIQCTMKTLAFVQAFPCLL